MQLTEIILNKIQNFKNWFNQFLFDDIGADNGFGVDNMATIRNNQTRNLGSLWRDNVSYFTGDIVTTKNGVFMSNEDDNQGNNPAAATDKWIHLKLSNLVKGIVTPKIIAKLDNDGIITGSVGVEGVDKPDKYTYIIHFKSGYEFVNNGYLVIISPIGTDKIYGAIVVERQYNYVKVYIRKPSSGGTYKGVNIAIYTNNI
jgi:hypothetical protein